DSPYAARTVNTRLSAVPPTVMMALTPSARVTRPPEKIAMYAEKSSPLGMITRPPASLMVARDERLVTTTTHIGTSTASTTKVSSAALPVWPTAVGLSSQIGRLARNPERRGVIGAVAGVVMTSSR